MSVCVYKEATDQKLCLHAGQSFLAVRSNSPPIGSFLLHVLPLLVVFIDLQVLVKQRRYPTFARPSI